MALQPKQTLAQYLAAIEPKTARLYPYIVVTEAGYYSIPMTGDRAYAFAEACKGRVLAIADELERNQ